MRFDVPVGVPDPAQRIRQIHERTGRVRHEKSLPYTQWIAGALNMMPPWYIGSILRHVDFLCSDVPGIPVPVFLGSARVVTQYAFGPIIGAAVNVTLLTYVDTGAIPDYDVFSESLVAGFDEVRWRSPRLLPDVVSHRQIQRLRRSACFCDRSGSPDW
jgi:diacylglycerol O-acyltransferase / wax synthase